ncbi:MAG: 2-C-methyl-D-erythritol 2,4-cyclodiphosphate synthase [Pseudomonadota bacterium]|nr:2-C-methyl-D-erythritol 2,4-cyclodiphosphate synthase [Pseudomonadota bacterium]
MARIGHGYDLHRLVADRPLILGGITVPFAKGLLGHSDADVVLHAICDALLGAAALGDLGQHFPDTEARFANADSRTLLRHIKDLLTEDGHTISNVDVSLLAQSPKLSPYREQMRQNIADDLNLSLNAVSVKFTTTEGLGEIGNGEAMSAYAVVLLE